LEKLLINGGKRLTGTIKVGGAKNAAVAILPAALLSDSPCVISNLPYIDDVIVISRIMEQLNARVAMIGPGKAVVNATGQIDCKATSDMIKKMRGSIYLLGALLGREGRVEMLLPGGCEIGARPIDQHIKGFEALGASIDISHGTIKAQADKLVGA